MHQLEANNRELPTVDIEKLKGGSTVTCLEAALAIQVGKLMPFGYDQVANFFRTEHGRTTPAHNVWFMVEAEVAKRTDDLSKEFPHTRRLAQYIIIHMQQANQNIVSSIMQRVSRRDYTFNG